MRMGLLFWTLPALLVSACGLGDNGVTDAGPAGADAAGGGVTSVDASAPEAVGLSALRIAPDAPQIPVGRSRQLTVTGTYADGTSKDLTQVVRWSTSDAAVATIENSGADKGRVHIEKTGHVTVTATLGEVSASIDIGKACQYPEFDLRMALGQAIPPMFWDTAYGPENTPISYKLEDVACDESVSVIVFVLGAGWCGACSAYAQRLNGEAAEFEAAGGRIVYVELQDANGEVADSKFAWEHLHELIGDGPGIRVGDMDTRPGNLFLTNNADVQGLPTVYVVRRSDMKVITTADILGDRPLVDVARQPDLDWEHPPEQVFMGNCGAADEEPGEPNDTPAQATPIRVGDVVHGGVCDATGDFYQVDADGPWLFTLNFSSAQADLDVYVWDADKDMPLRVNGDIVGSEGTGDTETFTHQGPALVKIMGFRRASTTYTLSLTTP